MALPIGILYLVEGYRTAIIPNVEFTPETTTDKSLTWSSNNTAVATVDPITGKVSAVAAGSATITAKQGDLSANLTLTVISTAGTEKTTIKAKSSMMATVKVAAGEAIYVDWGDGSTGLYPSDGTTEVNCSHSYGERSPYDITIITKGMTLLKYGSGGYWTELDITQNTELTFLKADGDLKSIDLSHNTKLKEINLSYNYQLLSLDLSNCTDLETALLQECTSLATLNVSGCAKLKKLNCNSAKMPSLDFSTCTDIAEITCGNNPELTNLRVTGLTNLTSLLGDNCAKLDLLNLNGCSALRRASVYSCDLASITVDGCTNLEELLCDRNRLPALDVSNTQKLWSLDVSANKMDATAIDALFGSLNGTTSGSAKTVDIKNNPGTGTCTESIATGKGWTVKKQ